MLVKGEVIVNNRLMHDSRQRPCQASIGVIKSGNKGSLELMQLVVFTAKNKAGTKYQVLKNLDKVYSRFLQEGKTTISFKNPPHDICISRANPETLKKLLHALKLGQNGMELKELNLKGVIPGSIDLEKPKSEMKITNQSEYPTTSSFPSTLEKLWINNCRLRKLDSRVLRLTSLSTLSLSDNLLSELPDSMDSLTSLKELDLSNNKFAHWPKCLFTRSMSKQLRLLNMSENDLTYIPYDILELVVLTNLQLRGNKLASVGRCLGHLVSLRFLNISGNQIPHLTTNFMKLHLQSLDIAGNPWKYRGFNNVIFNGLDAFPSLLELSKKVVRKKRLSIPVEEFPARLISYVVLADECICGQPCFERRACYMTQVDVRTIAETVISDEAVLSRTVLPKEGSLCSKKCLQELICSTFY